MASIRNAAQWVLDDCRDGIGWVAIWKEGRGWESERIYGVDFDEPTYTATIDDAVELYQHEGRDAGPYCCKLEPGLAVVVEGRENGRY